MKTSVLLLCGLESAVQTKVESVCSDMRIKVVNTADDFIRESENFNSGDIQMAVCGPGLDGIHPTEIAQTLKAHLGPKPIYFCCTEKFASNTRDLYKNGYDQAFYLPLDAKLFERQLLKTQAEILEREFDEFVSVPLADLQAGQSIDFDVMIFMPLNQKYVRIFKKGMVVKQESIQKLKTHAENVVFIKEGEQDKFQKYVENQIKNSKHFISNLVRREQAHGYVRDIFHTLMSSDNGSFQQGREILNQAQNLVTDIYANKSISNVLDELYAKTGQDSGDYYDQSMRVSTYAAFFALVMSAGRPEDLAVAGLFYHVGLSKCPEEILRKSVEQLTEEERKIYYKHPEDSIAMAKEKKVILVPETMNAILQHHEKLDGSGFPKQLRGGKVHIEAITLALANDFDELTAIRKGQAKFSVEQALAKLAQRQTGEIEMIRKLQNALSAKPAHVA